MEVFNKALISVLAPFMLMLICVSTGVFDKVDHETGLEHYAEQAWIPCFPFMPLNTLINFAYIGYGLYWCALTKVSVEQGVLKNKDMFLFYTFNIMCTLYGLVQLMRIVSQSTFWAIMDQWCTYPFFSLLLVWGLYYQRGWCIKRATVIMLLSTSSYSLSLCFRTGFELSLGIHIVAAVIGAVIAYQKHRAEETMPNFYSAILFCCGFVILKLLDHHLADLFVLFRYISGHFLSKICDVAQIACVNNFFFDLTLQKEADTSFLDQKKYFDNYDKDGHIQKAMTNDIMFEMIQRPKGKLSD